jgi:hypothetical protein
MIAGKRLTAESGESRVRFVGNLRPARPRHAVPVGEPSVSRRRESNREQLRGFGFHALRGGRQKMPTKRFFNSSLTAH